LPKEVIYEISSQTKINDEIVDKKLQNAGVMPNLEKLLNMFEVDVKV